jgi:hypothetical protein
MSEAGRRVKLASWPYSVVMTIGMLGTIISEHVRYLMVQWDGLTHPMAMRYEEVTRS